VVIHIRKSPACFTPVAGICIGMLLPSVIEETMAVVCGVVAAGALFEHAAKTVSPSPAINIIDFLNMFVFFMRLFLDPWAESEKLMTGIPARIYCGCLMACPQ
jgi:hypothetical protein